MFQSKQQKFNFKTVVAKRIQFDNEIIYGIVAFERHPSLKKTGLSVTGTQDRHKSKTRKAVSMRTKKSEPIPKILDFGLVVAGQRGLTS